MRTSRLPARARTPLEPRKQPVQARSAASVDAIVEATLQVLMAVGKDRLTTTRVALRAGVSIGTVYQYFPNKRSLLRAALARHLHGVVAAVEQVCEQQPGQTLEQMAGALIHTYFAAKMREIGASAALYAISADVEGAAIVRQSRDRLNQAVAAMLATATEPLGKEPEIVAAMLLDTMAGVSRRLLECDAPERQLAPLRQELVFFACSYLRACAATGFSAAEAGATAPAP